MKKSILLLFLLIVFADLYAGDVVYYVAPDGNDLNPGSIDKPFSTIEKARDAIRNFKASGSQKEENYIIRLREGTYHLAKSVLLDEKDSGIAENKIIIESYNNEKVIFSGGSTLAPDDFRIVTDRAILNRLRPESRGKVYEFDLKANNIPFDSTLTRLGFAHNVQPSSCILFFNKQYMQLAKWPNEGKLPIGEVIDPGTKPRWEKDIPPRGASFYYDYKRAENWTKANDIWLYGNFSNGYSDDNMQVKSNKHKKKIITTKQPHIYGVYSTSDSSNWDVATSRHLRGYHVYNLLEELDLPGEYYIDREAGKLYLWPPSPVEDANIELSQVTVPLLVLYNTSDISVRGITFECSRGMGIFMDRVSDICIDNCIFRNLGLMAVSLGEKYSSVSLPAQKKIDLNNKVVNANNRIQNCTIYNTGSGALHIQGGDRLVLKPGNNIIHNCEIYQYSRVNAGGVTAVTVEGVGNKISHCYIHDAPNMAVLFRGNNHVMEFNHLEKVCTESSDAGAVYAGRNPSAQGTIIRYNFFDSITQRDNMVCAVYLDDGTSGYKIYSNVFYRCGNSGSFEGFGAFHINSGLENYMTNNVFIMCKKAYGGTSWPDKKWIDYLTNVVPRRLKEVNIDSEIYQNAYPMLKTIRDTVNFPLRINYTSNDLLYYCGQYSAGMWHHEGCFQTYKDPGFIDAEKKNFTLKENSVVFKALPGFLPIPFDEIGLLKNNHKEKE